MPWNSLASSTILYCSKQTIETVQFKGSENKLFFFFFPIKVANPHCERQAGWGMVSWSSLEATYYRCVLGEAPLFGSWQFLTTDSSTRFTQLRSKHGDPVGTQTVHKSIHHTVSTNPPSLQLDPSNSQMETCKACSPWKRVYTLTSWHCFWHERGEHMGMNS